MCLMLHGAPPPFLFIYFFSTFLFLPLSPPSPTSFSGSDLDALCQAAQTIPAREFARALREESRARANARASEARERLAQSPADAPSPAETSSQTARSGGAKGRLGNAVWERSRDAAEDWMTRWREVIAEARQEASQAAVPAEAPEEEGRTRMRIRAITQADFHAALESVRPTGDLTLERWSGVGKIGSRDVPNLVKCYIYIYRLYMLEYIFMYSSTRCSRFSDTSCSIFYVYHSTNLVPDFVLPACARSLLKNISPDREIFRFGNK